MASLQKYIRNARTVLRQPAIALEYANWALQTGLSAHGPVRTVCGVRLGNFNGFSEYHSVAKGISDGELKFLRRHPLGEGAIIDVGANLGLFSLVIDSFSPKSRRIIAFEPAPSTFAALSKNIADNSATNIECHQLAVSDRDGKACFEVKENARANSSLVGASGASRGICIEIECTTLDRFVSAASLGQIAMLKVDVEGHEISVFRGAEHVWSNMRPAVVYFEVCPPLARAIGFASEEAAAFLDEKGYALYRILADGSLQEARCDEIANVELENWVGLDTR